MDGSWQDEYRDDEEDEENEFEEGYEAMKEQTVFLVDASEPMFEPFVPREHDSDVKASYFSYAVDMVKLFLKVKIFSNPSDEFAVMFYGTAKASNEANLENVYTYFSLDLTDATRLKELSELTDELFQDKVGSLKADAAAAQQDALRMGLWAASQALQRKSKSNKQVYLITRDDQPCGTSSTAREQTINRAEDLKHAQVSLQFMPLPTPGRLFNMDLFWKSLLETVRPQQSVQHTQHTQQTQHTQEDQSQSDVSSEFAYLMEYAHKESFSREDVEAITSADLVRRKVYRKRAVSRLRWDLVDGTSIAVQLYNLVQLCPKPKTINLHTITNSILRSERRSLHAETGQMLTDQDKVTVFQADAKVSRACFPETVRMSRDVVTAVKSVTEPGLKLLGFKPRALLKDFHQCGHSMFVRPNEADVKGSVTAFKAILAVMALLDKVAICSYRRGKNSDPRLVALLPQQEVRDSNGLQVFPEGMHMLQLPYMDDIRAPELEPSVVGAQIYRADQDQVELAGQLIDALTFPKDDLTGVSSFDCYSVRNPFLQRAYDVIERRAMNEPIEPIPVGSQPEWDETLPDTETMKAREEHIVAYMAAVYGEGCNVDGSKGTKRKAAAAEASADVAEAYMQYDWPALAAGSGKSGLDGLKVDELKLYLQKNKLRVSGKKAELVDRVKEHVMMNAGA